MQTADKQQNSVSLEVYIEKADRAQESGRRTVCSWFPSIKPAGTSVRFEVAKLKNPFPTAAN
jgi:hypothetical protein